MIKATLRKISSNHENVRTNEIIGEAPMMPMVGFCFTFIAEPLDADFSVRYLKTTEIKEVRQLNRKTVEFETQNSTYQLETSNET